MGAGEVHPRAEQIGLQRQRPLVTGRGPVGPVERRVGQPQIVVVLGLGVVPGDGALDPVDRQTGLSRLRGESAEQVQGLGPARLELQRLAAGRLGLRQPAPALEIGRAPDQAAGVARGRDGARLVHAAFLVFPAAAAGTGIVSMGDVHRVSALRSDRRDTARGPGRPGRRCGALACRQYGPAALRFASAARERERSDDSGASAMLS